MTPEFAFVVALAAERQEEPALRLAAQRVYNPL
jgi:hypothetical protein